MARKRSTRLERRCHSLDISNSALSEAYERIVIYENGAVTVKFSGLTIRAGHAGTQLREKSRLELM